MRTLRFSARYAAAMTERGGRCPIEAGVLGRLGDHECRYGRLGVRPDPCVRLLAGGGAALLALPRSGATSDASRRAA